MVSFPFERLGFAFKIYVASENILVSYLAKGLLKTIIVKSEYAIVRKKEQQIGHSLELHFNLKIVNDSIKYEDENIKSLGYKVVSGSNKLQTEAQKFVTSRKTKAKKKE